MLRWVFTLVLTFIVQTILLGVVRLLTGGVIKAIAAICLLLVWVLLSPLTLIPGTKDWVNGLFCYARDLLYAASYVIWGEVTVLGAWLGLIAGGLYGLHFAMDRYLLPKMTELLGAEGGSLATELLKYVVSPW